ncbi:hypothetical protein KDN24_24370 [Bacillus sp. Bva_UNVM-123]|uniref:hypothetical protein n=1 Tax=Bacillus sp. Bva_UNVM-123 TaxID=2829798 RepID=UPI00391F0B94
MKKANQAVTNRYTFLFSAIFITIVSMYTMTTDLLHNRFPNSIMLFALGLNQFMMAYLSPHLYPSDERSKSIVGKAMFINYFVLFGTLLILSYFTFSFSAITLTSFQTIIIIGSVISFSVPFTMVIYSKLL